MRYATIPGIDKPVARLIQGTVPLTKADLVGGFSLLDGVMAVGGTTFDTAHGYNDGDSERILGQWMAERGNREQVVVISKGAHHNRDRKRVTPYDITGDLMDSLTRLKTDYIDLYLLHRDDPAVEVGPIVEILNEHQRAGRIQAFGGSNWTHQRMAAANEYATAHGLIPFTASSPNFSLAEQIQEPWSGCVSIGGPAQREARAWYQAEKMAVVSWSSLAGGLFTGRIQPADLADPSRLTDYFDRLSLSSYGSVANFTRRDRATQLAGEKGVSLPQLGLAYVFNSPLNTFAITGSRTPAEFADNVGALDVVLTGEELAWLEG